MQRLVKELQKYYFKVLVPGIVMVVAGVLYEQYGIIHFNYPGKWASFALLLVVLLFAYILPLWMRIHALNKFKKQDADWEDFEHFEHNAILMAVAGLYFAPVAFVLRFPDIPKFAIAFAAIYSLYYFYPSDKKLKMDLKLFRLKPEDYEDN